MILPEIARAAELLPLLNQGHAMVGEGLRMRLFGPESRAWFHACRFWVLGGVPPASEEASLAVLRTLCFEDRRLANLFLDCARALIESGGVDGVSEARIADLAKGAGVAEGLVRDSLVELASPDDKIVSRAGILGGALRGPERSQTVTALLIEERGGDRKGVVADLRLELLPRGLGQVYPIPALAFLRRDREFGEAAEMALGLVKRTGLWPARCDLRWRLSRRDNQPLCTLLLGNSLGGCFAFGLERLLADESGPFKSLCKLALAGVAVSASLRADGTLAGVGDIMPKLLAAAREQSFPRLHTVIVSSDQELDFPGFEEQPKGSNVFCAPVEDFHVLRAPTLDAGAELLRRDGQERWHGIDCQLPPPDPDFTGRAALFERVRRFLAARDCGCLILQGEMGIGKSAFLAALLHAERANGGVPVYHLISSQHTGTPEQIAACLYDRLRRKHRVLEPSEWARFEVEVKLERLMVQLSEKLQAVHSKEVLYLEAADQAQLSPGKFLLPDSLGKLPRNFLCVVTSRFQTHWHKLPDQVEVCNLSEVIEDQVDVRDYLVKKAAQVDPPLEEEFIERIVGQSPTPVFFTVVSCFRRLQDPATAEETRRQLRSDPSLWAVPPQELIATALKDGVAQAQAKGIAEDEFWLALVLLTVTGDEHLGTAQLEHLAVLTPERKAVLEGCASFFQSRPSIEEPGRPYVFAHPGYIREIQERAGPGRLRRCHEILARGCSVVLSDSEDTARGYATRHWAAHLRHAHNHDKLCSVLTDLPFLLEALGVESACGGDTTGREQSAPAVSVFRLAYEFRRAREAVPEGHPKHLELKALGGVIDKYSHLLQEDPSLLPQLLHNELIWLLGNQTGLGDRIRALVSRQKRPWLRSLAPPARRQSLEPVRVLSGHQKSVISVAFSPNGKMLASGSADKTIGLWSSLSGESVAILQGHQAAVNAVAFSPDGLQLASGSSDGTIGVWDPRTRRSLRRLDPGSGPVLALAFTRNGSTLVSAGADGQLYFWDLRTWRQLRKCAGHGAAVRSLAVSPDDRWVVSGGEDKTIRVCGVADGLWRTTIRQQDRWVEAVAFLEDSRTIVSSGGFRCGDVKFWNLEGHCIRTWPGHDEGIKALAVSPDGLRLASGSYDGKLLVRNVRTCAGFLPMGHTDRIEAVAFSKDGNTLASASADRKIRIWDVSGEPTVPVSQDERGFESGEPVLQALCFAAEGRLAVSCGKTHVLKLLETETGTARGVFHGQPDRNLSCVAASPNSQVVAAGSFQQVRLWQLGTISSPRTLCGHAGWVLAASFSPDGKRIAAGGEDDNLILWDVASGSWLRTFPCRQTKVRAVAFCPDGRWLTSGGEDGTLRFWSPDGDEPPRSFELHKGPVITIAFAPRGSLVATGSEDESLRLMDYAAGIQFPPMRLHRGAVTALAFSPDARWLASGSADGTLRIWNTHDGRPVAWMPCADRVLAIRFDAQQLRIQVADAGGASHRPSFLFMELVNLRPERPEDAPHDYQI